MLHRNLRRSLTAVCTVLAAGGSLAVASSASATQLPFGSSTDTGSTTVYGLYNQATAGLVEAGATVLPMIDEATGGAYGTDTYATVTDSTLTSADVTGIGTALESIPSAVWTAIEAESGGELTAGDVSALETAAGSWSALGTLATTFSPLDVSPFQNGLYSVNGDLAVSSSVGVGAAGGATAYSVSLGLTSAASGGYVLPTAYSLTFPSSGFRLSKTIESKEINANGAAAPGSTALTNLEAGPPAADQIGTVTITSPLASQFLAGTTAVGGIYLVNTSGNTADPELELDLGAANYVLGQLSGLSLPMTASFGELNLSVLVSAAVGSDTLAMPFSNLTLTFPESSSPFEADSCSAAVGTATGTATDEVAALAYEFGDTTDGLNAAGAATPVTLDASSPTVSDRCVPSASAGSVTGAAKGKAKLSLTLKGNAGTPFDAATITLPTGLSAKRVVASGDEKSVRVSGRRVVVQLKRTTTSAVISLSGLKVSGMLKAAVTAKRAKSLQVSYAVDYRAAGSSGVLASTTGSVAIKKLS